MRVNCCGVYLALLVMMSPSVAADPAVRRMANEVSSDSEVGIYVEL